MMFLKINLQNFIKESLFFFEIICFNLWMMFQKWKTHFKNVIRKKRKAVETEGVPIAAFILCIKEILSRQFSKKKKKNSLLTDGANAWKNIKKTIFDVVEHDPSRTTRYFNGSPKLWDILTIQNGQILCCSNGLFSKKCTMTTFEAMATLISTFGGCKDDGTATKICQQFVGERIVSNIGIVSI